MRGRVKIAAAVLAVLPGVATAQGLPIPDIPGLGNLECSSPGPVASAIDAPFALAIARVDGITTCVNLSGFIRSPGDGKLWILEADGIMLDNVGRIDRVTASFNPDPFITFGATTTNIVAGPVTYGFLFGTPIVPGFYNSASSTGGVSVTNAPGTAASVSSPGLYPTYVSGYGTLGGSATNLGVDLGTAPCVAAGPPIGTTTCNYGTTSNTFAPAFYDNLEALLTYNQTGLSGVASWSGAVALEMTAVPEPMTLTLVGGGVLLLGLVRRVRQRTS